MTKKQRASERAEIHAALLKDALSRPGVREMMLVYGQWQEQDRTLDAYRAATKDMVPTGATDHANAS